MFGAASSAYAAWAGAVVGRAAGDGSPVSGKPPDGRFPSLTPVGQTGSHEVLARAAVADDRPAPERLAPALGVAARKTKALSLAAMGKTNRDIDAIQGPQPLQVNRHLKQALATLGLQNRTAAAALTAVAERRPVTDRRSPARWRRPPRRAPAAARRR